MNAAELIEREIADLVNRGYTERRAVEIVAARHPGVEITVETTETVVEEEEFESSDDWYDSGCSDYWEDSGC